MQVWAQIQKYIKYEKWNKFDDISYRTIILARAFINIRKHMSLYKYL